MKALKRIAAVLSAALLIGSLSIGASAAVTDEQKKEITDALFEAMWRGSLENYYWRKTNSTVPIKDNPLAATTYMTIEAEVAVCDNTLLEKIYNEEVSLRDFYSEDDYDYLKAKKISKYAESLLQGYEMTPVDFENGVWEMDDEINGGTFYGYFREDAENFKLYDNDTNELLGTYPRLLDYGYLDDENSGGSGGGAGGSTGTNSTASEAGASYTESYSSHTSSVGSQTAVKIDPRSSAAASENSTAKTGSYSRYDTDNPAVTPEIASAVDAMKSNAGNTSAESAPPTKSGPPEKNNNPTVVIVIVAVIVVGAAAFFFTKKKKDGSQKK